MRPRVSLGAALTLGAFLLTAPAAFVLLPLALLLVTTRPARLVTILWIVVGAAWSGLWLAAPGPLAEQVLKGWTVVTSGVFLLLVLDGRRRPADAAVTAVLTASLAALTWLRVFRVEFDSVMGDVLRIIWAQYRAIGDAAPGLRGQLADFSLKVADASVLIPGGMMLLGVAGCLLAWRWYHWFGDRPVGDTPGPFREFRFSDHLIWLLVLGLAGTILQVAGVLSSAAGWPVDLLVLLGGLYAARGLAVARSSAARLGMGLPLPLLLAALVFVLFLLPFALAALLGVGLADTWLDFRRRSAAAPGE